MLVLLHWRIMQGEGVHLRCAFVNVELEVNTLMVRVNKVLLEDASDNALYE